MTAGDVLGRNWFVTSGAGQIEFRTTPIASFNVVGKWCMTDRAERLPT